MCWIDVYLSPPDFVAHDAGKQFMTRVFQANAELLYIETKAVPVESAISMTFVERYHDPLQRTFHIIKAESSDLHDDYALQLAVESINGSAGRDDVVPTLLVYGALPRLGFPSDVPAPTVIQRASAFRKATFEMEKHLPVLKCQMQ